MWGPGCPTSTQMPDNDPLNGIPGLGYAPGSGLKVLGLPVGRPGEFDVHESLWAKRIAELETACDALSRVPDPQIQHCLLRQCLDAAKVQYLLRGADWSSDRVFGHIKAADEAILSVVEAMVGLGLPPSARAQVGLPFSEGGCGIRLPSNVAGPARIAGIATYVRSGRTQVGVPSLAHHIVPRDFSHIVACLRRGLGAARRRACNRERRTRKGPQVCGRRM